MKNKAVEAMARIQFNIPDDTDVSVTFIFFNDEHYEFEIEWWSEESVRHQCNCRRPQLAQQKQDFAV